MTHSCPWVGLITERRVPELIPVLGSQPAGEVSHKPGGRLPLLSARPAVTPQPLRGLGYGYSSSPHRYGNSHAICDHTVLPAIRIPAITPAEAGTRLSDPGGMQG